MRKNCTPPAKLITTLFQLLSNSRSFPFFVRFSSAPARFFASLNGAGFTLFRAPSRRSSVAPTIATFPHRQTSREWTCHYRYAPSPLVHPCFFVLTPARVPVSRDRSRAFSFQRPPFQSFARPPGDTSETTFILIYSTKVWSPGRTSLFI